MISVLMVAVWEFSYTVSQNLRLSKNMVKEVQAISLARAAFRGSLAILKFDNSGVDGPHDTWRQMLPPMIPLGQGMAKLEITAEDSKININHLVNDYDDSLNSTIFSYCQELFVILGYDINKVYSIVDFIDNNTRPLSDGAEENYYRNLSPPITIKDGPLDSIYELAAVKGITMEMLHGAAEQKEGTRESTPLEEAIPVPKGLLPYFTVYGDYAKDASGHEKNYGTLNLNFIPLILLKAMDPDISQYTLEELHKAREKANFTTKEVTNQQTMMVSYGISEKSYKYLFGQENGDPRLHVQSTLFRIKGMGEVGNVKKVVEAVVKRKNKRFRTHYYTEY